MSEVWVSSVMSNSEIGNKQGMRAKYYGHDWEAPTHIVPDMPPDNREALRRHAKGETLARTAFPEASYVFSPSHFKRVRDLFTAGGFYAVKGELADVLARFDLGQGGLIPYQIYEADKTTQLEGPFYLLNFGAYKDSFLPHESRRVEPFFTIERHGVEVWDAQFGLEDKDIAVSAAALLGADLWFEPKLKSMIFMSGRLVQALLVARIKIDLRLTQCRIVNGGG